MGLRNLNPIVRFFIEVVLMVSGTAILLWVFGLIWGWTSSVQYSNGFFLACVVLAAISSFGIFLKKPGSLLHDESKNSSDKTTASSKSGLEKFFETRSFNFKMLMAAVLCLLLSILITQ